MYHALPPWVLFEKSIKLGLVDPVRICNLHFHDCNDTWASSCKQVRDKFRELSYCGEDGRLLDDRGGVGAIVELKLDKMRMSSWSKASSREIYIDLAKHLTEQVFTEDQAIDILDRAFWAAAEEF